MAKWKRDRFGYVVKTPQGEAAVMGADSPRGRIYAWLAWRDADPVEGWCFGLRLAKERALRALGPVSP